MDTNSEQELERLRQELAEARRESDARAAELRKLHDETRQLRQWRADLFVQLQSKKNKPLWRLLSAARNAKQTLKGQGGDSSVLDDFTPPPLEALAALSEPTPSARPLPLLFSSARNGICFFWKGATSDATLPERIPFTIGSPAGDAPAMRFCDSLITGGQNPLAALRKIIQGTPPGAEIWIAEPDAVNFPNFEPTTIQHLLLDETEPNRERGTHAVDALLFKDILTELTARGEAEWIDTWSQSNARSQHHLAVLRRVCPPDGPTKPESEAKAEKSTTPSSTPGATIVLLHANPFQFGAGGTEQIALVRTEALALPRAILVYPNGPREIVVAEVRNGDLSQRTTHTFPLRQPLLQYANSNHEAEDLVLWIARQFGAASLIVDHLLNWPLRLPLVLKKAGIDYAMVLHDFYIVCPSFNLINAQTGQRCATHLDGAAKEDCSDQCLATHFAAALHSPAPHSLREHQSAMQELLKQASAVICPDASVQRRAAAATGLPLERIRVIPHGMDATPATIHETRGPRLRVALLGNLNSPNKGSVWLGEILNRARTLPIDWHVFGSYDAEFSEAPGGATITRHGPYERTQIVELLKTHAADVAHFTSIVEESFSLTLSESFCAGVPAIAPNLGALGERVRSSGFGWTVPAGDSSAVIALLQRFSANPTERNTVAAKMTGFKHVSPSENAQEFKRALGEILARPSLAPLSTVPSVWLERAANYERELARAFDESRDEPWTLEASAVIDVANRTFTITPLRFSAEKKHVLMLDVTSPIRDTLQVNFGTLAAPVNTAAQCVRHALEIGRQRICVELSHPLLDGPLHVLFASRPGAFTLHEARLRVI